MKPPGTRSTELRTYCTACAQKAAAGVVTSFWFALAIFVGFALFTLIRFLM
jgi:hypothetical protein